MKNLLSRLFPYPWYLSLVCTWLFITALYVLAVFYRNLYWITHFFAPIDVEATAFTYAGVLVIFYQPAPTPLWAGILFCAVPLSALIFILGGDWALQKIGVPRTPIKLLSNVAFLFTLNVLVHMALYLTWKPWVIFAPPLFAP